MRGAATAALALRLALRLTGGLAKDGGAGTATSDKTQSREYASTHHESAARRKERAQKQPAQLSVNSGPAVRAAAVVLLHCWRKRAGSNSACCVLRACQRGRESIDGSIGSGAVVGRVWSSL